MIVLDPITINAPPATPQTVEIGNTAVFRPSKVRLANESPYLLKVQLGGDTHWLSAWTADVYTANGQSNLTVSAQLIGQSANAPSSTLLVSIAGEGEEFSGTYPIGLDRMTSIATGTVNLTASSVSITGNVPVTNPAGQALTVQQPRKYLGAIVLNNSTAAAQNFTPDAGALHLIILLPHASKFGVSVQVVGTTSGIDYLAAINGGVGYTAPSQGELRIPVPIDPEVDATYSVQVGFGQPITLTARVSESFLGDAVDVLDGIPLSVDLTDKALRQVGAVSINNGSATNPNKYVNIAVTIPATSAANLIPAGTPFWLHSFALWVDEASGFTGYLRTTAPALLLSFHATAAGLVCPPFDFKGLPFSNAYGIDLYNQDTVPHVVRGILTYYS